MKANEQESAQQPPWRELLASIEVRHFRGYGPKPLPGPADEVVREFLARFSRADAATRESIAKAITSQHRDTVLAFAERMASYAVRSGSVEALRDAALAYALQLGAGGDERDALPVLALLYDAALRLKQPPAELFDGAGSLVGERPRKAFAAFLARNDHDKSLAAMLYTVGADADGFRYVRTW